MADFPIDLGVIPEAKVQDVKEALLANKPNTQTKDDPNWVDPGDGSTPDQIPKYTDAQWLVLTGRNYYKSCYNKGKVILAQKAAITNEEIFE